MNGVEPIQEASEKPERDREMLGKLDELKTQFFANISNEFRTPLTMMLGPIEEELAEEEQPLPPGRRAGLELAHRNGLRLLRMVNALLDFSHIETGQLEATFEPVDLAAVTEELANSFRVAIEKAGLRLSTRLETLPEPIYVDREMWTKIVLNLLSNALKHTFKGGITLSLFASDESHEIVELRVDDTGIGIPKQELPKLFQRFHRVKGARARSDEGTGVGLAIVRSLTRLHGGSVTVTSREGLGSSFCVRLRRGTAHLAPERIVHAFRPVATDCTQVGGYVEEALRWPNSGNGLGNLPVLDLGDASTEPESRPQARPRVLWADNNLDLRNYVARLLQRTYEVNAVSDIESVLSAATQSRPDIILLGATLPGRDRLELLKELRGVEGALLTPVILLLARADEDAGIECLDAGADDYLIIPFSSKALLARVRSSLALARLRKESADKLEAANKELEAFSYSVSHDLRNPLRAIDGFTEALMEEAWNQLDEQGRHYLTRVRAATERMNDLIEDLLSLSQISRAFMSRDRVDLSALSQQIRAELSAAKSDRTVEWVIADGLTCDADPRLVRVLLENLLGNAWKYTSKRASARIEVGSDKHHGETVFFVSDNGAGFSMEHADKLFAPFQRLHTTAEFPGTGIGLATVHRIVTRHAGRIWAQGVPDEGATFLFTLSGQP
jgi:signal transduction histidine kinase